MIVEQTNLPGVVIIKPKVFEDQRGFFTETFQKKRFAEHGISTNFVQDNLSCSTKGVLRGLHYQLPHSQGKLVSVVNGKVFDVAVDIRKSSPTFGQHISVILDDANHQQLYVPPGFAHGFCVMSETAHFIYKCSDYYFPKSEYGIRFDDPDLNIDWPIKAPILSEKDKNYCFLTLLRNITWI